MKFSFRIFRITLLFTTIYSTLPAANLYNNIANDDTVAANTSSIKNYVNEKRLWQYVADLSAADMNGRLTGSVSGKKAEDYVEQKMREIDIHVTTQEVKFPLYEVQTPTAFTLLEENGNLLKSFEYLTDYREVDFSGAGKIEGQLEFVGYGIKDELWNDYEGINLQGKVAVILSGKPDSLDIEFARADIKYDTACKEGAIGVVFVPTGRTAEMIEAYEDEAEMFAMDLKRTWHPEFIHETIPAIFLKQNAVKEIFGMTGDELKKIEKPYIFTKKVQLEQHSSINKEALSRNVLGVFPGTDPELSKEVIIVGGHYDHLGIGADGRIFYGAADNASGAAVVLECAATLAEMGFKPKRTIVFALWTAEEQGLWGSTYYVNESPLFPLEDTKMMIQIDYLDNIDGPYLANVDDNVLVQKFASDAMNAGVFQPLDNKGRCGSDDCPFRDKGIPAYRFVAGGENHHRSSDTIENLSIEMVKKVADSIVDGLLKCAD